MIKRFGKLILVAMLSLTLGLHWAFLQTLAWASMLATYSQDAPIAIAVQQTFDGQHPCKLCKLVRSTKSSNPQQDSTQLNLLKKLDFFVDQKVACPTFFTPLSSDSPETAFTSFSRSEPPPFPPPRTA